MKTVEYFRNEVDRIGKILCDNNIPQYLFNVASLATHSGEPHLEINDHEYHYVITERGSEFERKTTNNADDILYWFVSDSIGELATRFEVKNRVEHQDCRRLLFAKEIEFFDMINSGWAKRKELEYERILHSFPFEDGI